MPIRDEKPGKNVLDASTRQKEKSPVRSQVLICPKSLNGHLRATLKTILLRHSYLAGLNEQALVLHRSEETGARLTAMMVHALTVQLTGFSLWLLSTVFLAA